MLPLLAVVVGGVAGGGLSDWLLKRTGSRNIARRWMGMVCMFLCAGLIFWALVLDDALIAVLVISAGSFFAARQGFVSPESFTYIESAVILAIVVLGGMGSQIGVVLAAVLLIGIPEFFRELAQFRMLAFGAAMVGIMIWRPRGLLAHRDPTILLHRRRSARQQQADKEARA